MRWITVLIQRSRGQRGATAVEYAVMASMIVAVIVAAVYAVGQRTNDNFSCTDDTLQTQTAQCP